jgi:hypothetical protein
MGTFLAARRAMARHLDDPSSGSARPRSGRPRARPFLSGGTALVAALVAHGCAKDIRATIPAPPGAAQMSEFWVEPADLASRDLFWGPGGQDHAPDPKGTWTFEERDNTGFSPSFDVEDPSGVEWSAKVGAEAQAEVVASRLMWALGFHQPPTYYVKGWSITGEKWSGPQDPARFRPDLPGMKKVGEWSWHENPFVGTAPWKGGLVMMVLLGNSDLKPPHNAIYDLEPPRAGVRRWYVVRDLGQSFGETGFIWPERNDIEEWEKEAFILGLREDGTVRFNYSGRFKELFRDLRPEDVRWTAERLARLSDRQLDDAFRAAEYPPELRSRFIRRLKEKIAEGLALAG